MHPYLLTLIAILFICYGVVKVTVSLLSLYGSHGLKEKIGKIPFLKSLIHNDETFAGRCIHYALFVFGLFTFFHGFALLGMLPKQFIDILESPVMHCWLNGLIGVFLLSVYSLVLFTNVKISKDPHYTKTYKLVGLGGGILFIAAVPAILLYEYLKNAKRNKDWTFVITLGLIVLSLFMPFIYILYTTLKKDPRAVLTGQEERSPAGELATLAMIPLNFV